MNYKITRKIYLFIMFYISGFSYVFSQTCESSEENQCFYVATNGDDENPGTYEEPFKTFRPAITQANPGDFIYVRGGTYGFENSMVTGVRRDYESEGATSCPDGQVLADGYCFSDQYEMIGIKDFSGWASNTSGYTVSNGDPDNPITIKAYPGEHPVFDVSGFTESMVAVRIYLKSYWIIDGIEISGGMVNIYGGSQEKQTHDITIRNCTVHDITIDGGDNPGIIRIDRGDYGGPYNIFIHNNTLYGIYDFEEPGEWEEVVDAQHFGSITTLSAQNYLGYDHGGTGYIEITGNHVYHCPMFVFFKNPMYGPIKIENNVIHHCGRLGTLGSSNVRFKNNLVYDIDIGFWNVGKDAYEDPEMNSIAGQNAFIQNNTFVGLDHLLAVRGGTGHHISKNVFYGMTGKATNAIWDTRSYLTKSEIWPDTLEVERSLLQEIYSDSNCFITPYKDFQFVCRYLPPETTGDEWLLEHYTKAEAESVFGFDQNSSVEISSDIYAYFEDPDNHNYRLKAGAGCIDLGVDFSLIPDLVGFTSVFSLLPESGKINAYPNPFSLKSGEQHIVFKGINHNSRIEIYNLYGQMIDIIYGKDNEVVYWNMDSKAGNKVVPGIYIYRVVLNPGEEITGSISIY